MSRVNIRDIFQPVEALSPVNIEDMFTKCRKYNNGQHFIVEWDFPQLLKSDMAPQIMGELIKAVDDLNELFSKEPGLMVSRNILQQYGLNRYTIPRQVVTDTALTHFYESSQYNVPMTFWGIPPSSMRTVRAKNV